MRVKIRCALSDHLRSYEASDEPVEMEEGQARRLAHLGMVEILEAGPAAAPETATLTGGTEQAVQARGRRKSA